MRRSLNCPTQANPFDSLRSGRLEWNKAKNQNSIEEIGTTLRNSWIYLLLAGVLGILLYALLRYPVSVTITPLSIKKAMAKEQTAHNIVIGLKNEDRLDYLDMTAGGAIRTVSFSPRLEIKPVSIDLTKGNEASSTDQKWTAYCNRNAECKISRIGDPTKSFSLSRKGVLTPLYWSPNERFVFFVRKGPTWRLPSRCSLEDERDVTVYDLAQYQEKVVSTVCGGFPYGGLRWYRLKLDLAPAEQ